MIKEIWKQIPGYVGYEVSDLGRVRSIDRIVLTQRGPRKYKGRLLRPGPQSPCGHLSVSLGRCNSQLVHSLVLLTFTGPRSRGHDVRHRNGNVEDNRLRNLQYGTRGQNEEDKVFHSKNRPVASGYRFSPKDIKYIRNSVESGVLLAREFGCSGTTISYIRHYRTYRQVA